MFERPHHDRVAKVLRALDSDLLSRCACYFSGGTAIVLLLGEYRESLDIDFLCASQDGYRRLRQLTFGGGLDGLLSDPSALRILRDVRADQYGIRTQIAVDDVRIRFEIVREARVALSGGMDPALAVPTLSRVDMYCEKLLANADRHADRATLSRDIIDLSMMMSRWGPIPDASWAKARGAYGDTVDRAFERAAAGIRDRTWLRACVDGMAMDRALEDEILAQHGGPTNPAGAPD